MSKPRRAPLNPPEHLAHLPPARFIDTKTFRMRYRCSYERIKMMLQDGLIQGFFNGFKWIILDPGWELIQRFKDIDVAMEYMPIFNQITAAVLLNRADATVEWYRKTGRLKGHKRGKRYYYRLVDIREFIEDRENRPRNKNKPQEPDAALLVWAYERLKLETPFRPHEWDVPIPLVDPNAQAAAPASGIARRQSPRPCQDGGASQDA